MGRALKAADEREDALNRSGGGGIPANPYASPIRQLEDRDGYPFAVPQQSRLRQMLSRKLTRRTRRVS